MIPGYLKGTANRTAIIRKELLALYFAYRNPATGWFPKFIILLTLTYALSPIDLIPDFIPVLGYLDDLIIIPMLISLSIKTIPSDILHDAGIDAGKQPVSLKKSLAGAFLIIAIWIILAAIVLKTILTFL